MNILNQPAVPVVIDIVLWAESTIFILGILRRQIEGSEIYWLADYHVYTVILYATAEEAMGIYEEVSKSWVSRCMLLC